MITILYRFVNLPASFGWQALVDIHGCIDLIASPSTQLDQRARSDLLSAAEV